MQKAAERKALEEKRVADRKAASDRKAAERKALEEKKAAERQAAAARQLSQKSQATPTTKPSKSVSEQERDKGNKLFTVSISVNTGKIVGFVSIGVEVRCIRFSIFSISNIKISKILSFGTIIAKD